MAEQSSLICLIIPLILIIKFLSHLSWIMLMQQASKKMVRRQDHVSIDFQKLANSLRGKFETLYPLSEDCCIYRVPPKIRMLNESLYTPKMVSIGPLHHGKELIAMEEYKLRYLQQFLGRTSVSMEDFLRFIKDKEIALRNCYAEIIELESEEFVEMILLDAVFVIEILLRYDYNLAFYGMDHVFTRPGMMKEIVFDLMVLENQLPIFILEDLFKLANPANPAMPKCYEGWTLSQYTCFFFKHICEDLLIEEMLLESYFSKAKHFVDLLGLCLQPPKRDDTRRQVDAEAAPNITKLHQSGMKFELASTRNLLDIRLNKGTLEIPKLTIGNMTIHLLRNLQTFEALHCGSNYLNDYVMLLNCLLSTSKDVDLLTEIGVIRNRILDSEGVSTLFRELSRDARLQYSQFYYSHVVKNLQDYCNSPCHKWKANLKQNYFNSPWASISVIAAAIILVLTLIQTICSIIGL